MKSNPIKMSYRLKKVKKPNSDQSNIKSSNTQTQKREPLGEMTTIYEQLQTDSQVRNEIENPEENILQLHPFLLDFSKRVSLDQKRDSVHRNLIQFYQQKEGLPTQFLKQHKIKSQYRAKMIDWMIEIFEEYKLNYSSLFYSVSIMDKLMENSKSLLEIGQLHLIGIGCIFTASQYNDVTPLSLKNMNDICYNKFSDAEIQKMELEIITTLNLELNISNTFVFVTLVLKVLMEIEVIPNKQLLIELSCYITKQSIYDYNLQSNYLQSEIACGVVSYVILLLNAINDIFPLSHCVLSYLIQISIVKECFNISDIRLTQIGEQVEILVNNFPYNYAQCQNLKVYNASIEEQFQQIKQQIKK